MSRILNPTDDVIRPKYDGAVYTFKPNEVVEITNVYAARDIVKRMSKYGLVDITYDEKIARKFSDDQLYVHEQRKMGIKNYLTSLFQKVAGHELYIQDCGEKKSVERYEIERSIKDVKVKIAKYQMKLEQLEKVDKSAILKQKSEFLKKQAEELLAQSKSLSEQSKISKSEGLNNADNSGGHPG